MSITFLPLVLALAACHNTGGVLPNDSSDPDSDADTDTDADTDADADSDADTDADTDADPATTYSGEVRAGGRYHRHMYSCSGPVLVEVTADGAVLGDATCSMHGYAIEGPVEGTVRGGSFSGTWAVEFGGPSFPIPVEGFVDDQMFTASFDERLDDLSINGMMEARRDP
jgi:hypothetical protein